MSLDITGITNGLVTITSELIGSRLSTVNAGGGTTKPSVIVNRSGGNKPNFPYAVVDHVGINSEGYSSSSNYMDDNEDEVTEIDYTGRFLIQVNGGISDDVLSICTELRGRLFTGKGNNLFLNNITAGRLLSVSSVTFFPTRLKTDFEEVARITIDLSLRDIIVDDTTSTIESIDLDGEIYNDFEQVDPPLSVNITAP